MRSPGRPRCTCPPARGESGSRLVPFSCTISARSSKSRVVDEERAAFAATHVLRLVEAQRSELTDASRAAAVERRTDPLRGVLDDEQVVRFGDLGERTHLTADACVVHRDDRLRARRDRCSTCVSSRHSVSGRISTNTGRPPRPTTALAVVTKVNDGMMTSSPGPMSASVNAISRAAVHDCVSSARLAPVWSTSHSAHRLENGPLLARCAFAIASCMYANSQPVTWARLKTIGSSIISYAPRVARRLQL